MLCKSGLTRQEVNILQNHNTCNSRLTVKFIQYQTEMKVSIENSSVCTLIIKKYQCHLCAEQYGTGTEWNCKMRVTNCYVSCGESEAIHTGYQHGMPYHICHGMVYSILRVMKLAFSVQVSIHSVQQPQSDIPTLTAPN